MSEFIVLKIDEGSREMRLRHMAQSVVDAVDIVRKSGATERECEEFFKELMERLIIAEQQRWQS